MFEIKFSKYFYSVRHKIFLNNKKNTLFDSSSETVNLIINVDNFISQTGLMDDMPRMYRDVKDQDDLQKYILFPDGLKYVKTLGFQSRSFFFNQEFKINEELPTIVKNFQDLLLETLGLIHQKITVIT